MFNRDPQNDCGRRFARGEHDDNRHFGHGRHRGGGGRSGPVGAELRRFFRHGDLRLVILQLIADKPRHGYEIIKAIEELVAGAYSPSPGVIYPTLTLLEELGYVAVSPGEGARKLHEVSGQPRHPVVSAICESLLDDEVLPLDVALLRQASPENIEMRASRTGATDLQPADARYPGSPLRLE